MKALAALDELVRDHVGLCRHCLSEDHEEDCPMVVVEKMLTPSSWVASGIAGLGVFSSGEEAVGWATEEAQRGSELMPEHPVRCMVFRVLGTVQLVGPSGPVKGTPG